MGACGSLLELRCVTMNENNEVSAREILSNPVNYEVLMQRARAMPLLRGRQDLVHDLCVRLLSQERAFESEEQFCQVARNLVYQQNSLRFTKQSRMKRSAFTVGFTDEPETRSGRDTALRCSTEGGYDETWRLATWADDPVLRAALKLEQGHTLNELKGSFGVTRQALKQRIDRTIERASRHYA
jgi:hypothetical protein